MKKVSIIIPTYNGSKWISRAIDSIKAQSYTDWELLVVDDGSVDDTGSIIRDLTINDHRIRYIKNDQNMGIQKSLNRGLREAKGEYIARLDDDDTWCDVEKLAKQVVFLDANPDYVLVGTGAIAFDENNKKIFTHLNPESDKEIRDIILNKNCFFHSSVVFVKKHAMDCGGYDESDTCKHVEDYDLWLKLGIRGKIANLKIIGVRLSIHADSLSSRNKIIQFKRSINLIKLYKNNYPNFCKAHIGISIRMKLYNILNLPIIKKVYPFLYKFYKNI